MFHNGCPCAHAPNQVEEPLYFVDFLRDPVVDDETGEVVEVRGQVSAGLFLHPKLTFWLAEQAHGC